jgi:hypothetical protein
MDGSVPRKPRPRPHHGTVQQQLAALDCGLAALGRQVAFIVASMQSLTDAEKAKQQAEQQARLAAEAARARPGRYLSVVREQA